VNPVRILTAGAATAAALSLLAYASAVPLAYHPQDAARLRLSWSARPERIEVCRQLSTEAQARRGEHMRQRVECVGGFATYALRVEVDDRAVDESVIHGAGLRHDRPLYLLRDYSVPPGQHRIRVTLTRQEKVDTNPAAPAEAAALEADTGLYAGRSQREATERARRERAAIPPSLVMDTTFEFRPRRVALVTFNAGLRILELRAEALQR